MVRFKSHPPNIYPQNERLTPGFPQIGFLHLTIGARVVALRTKDACRAGNTAVVLVTCLQCPLLGASRGHNRDLARCRMGRSFPGQALWFSQWRAILHDAVRTPIPVIYLSNIPDPTLCVAICLYVVDGFIERY
jgi:hypothetical protein